MPGRNGEGGVAWPEGGVVDPAKISRRACRELVGNFAKRSECRSLRSRQIRQLHPAANATTVPVTGTYEPQLR